MTTRTHLHSFFFSALLLSSLSAQDSNLKVRSFTLSGERHGEIRFWDGKTFVAQNTSTIQPSPVITLPYQNPLPVFTDTAPPPGRDLPQPDARVALPEGGSEILLLISDNGEKRQYMAMEDELSTADSRDWLFLNLTDSAIAFQVGREADPVLIQPKSRFTHRVTGEVRGGMPIEAAARLEGEVRTFFSTYWPVREDRRVIVMIVRQEERIRVRRIMERLPSS